MYTSYTSCRVMYTNYIWLSWPFLNFVSIVSVPRHKRPWEPPSEPPWKRQLDILIDHVEHHHFPMPKCCMMLVYLPTLTL